MLTASALCSLFIAACSLNSPILASFALSGYYRDMELEEMLADMCECLNLAKYHKGKLVLA